MLPQNLSHIDIGCFYDCMLSSVTSLNTIPPTLGEAAFMVEFGLECDLNVPAEAINAYKSAPVWRDFNIYPISTDGIDSINKYNADNIGKFVKDGQILIKHDGNVYNTNGQTVK